MRRHFLIAALAALAAPARPAVLKEVSGLVQVRAADGRWRPAGRLPQALIAGDSLRTGFRARAELTLEGTAALRAEGNTQLAFEESVRGGSAVSLLFGTARASARGLGGRPLVLRAPAASSRAAADAASWRVTAGPAGAVVEVEEGLVRVEDSRGGSRLLRAGERVEVDLAGLHETAEVPAPRAARRAGFAERMRRELALELGRDAAHRLASAELRRSEREQGRVLVDASGARVRAEEFVVRPAADSFSFVALNDRRGAGLSWYSWSGTFDRALPRDLSAVLPTLRGVAGGPAPWTLTSYAAARSNGTDSLVETASGGHQVDLNANADPGDDVGTGSFHATLFDDYVLSVNGVDKRGWSASGVQSQAEADASPLSLGLSYTANETVPQAGLARRESLESYSDGSELRLDRRGVGFRGGVRPGSASADGFLRGVFQETVTATEFGGRRIDVLVSPRALLDLGSLR